MGRNVSSSTRFFTFADEEITKIKGYMDSKNNCLSASISSYGNSNGEELVI